MRNSESEHSLRQRAAGWPHETLLENLTVETLLQITRREGIDFATALLFDRFQKSPRHGDFIQRIDSLRGFPLPRCGISDVKVVVVPGALYLERPDLGGDGRLVRDVAERCGWTTDLIPLASVGSATKNAQRICDWIARYSKERMILVSLSKGGADLKMAFRHANSSTLFRNIAAWVNVCGPLDGTRMANWILTSRFRTWLLRLQYRLQKRDFQFVTDLRHGSGSPLNFCPSVPSEMKIISLVGFPLRQHLTTPFSHFCHRTLAAHGPNDGTISLSDLPGWPGKIYPAWGMDHYFRPEKVARELIAAILQNLNEEITGSKSEGLKITESAAS